MVRNHDHAQIAAAPIFLVPSGQIQRDSIRHRGPIFLVLKVVDDLRPGVHPHWRRFCPHAEHTLPPDEKNYRLPHALPH
jgi:hypothetical protein